ncbi:MAG: glycosyltransferase [Saprospiraceae bacterium]|nr:glycosyltransferase [Saprospiraceae bacterium]
MPDPERPLKIVITRPNKYVYSETFIANHIKHLPGEIVSLWGKWIPRASDSGHSFGSNPLLWFEDKFNNFTGNSLAIFRRKRLKAFLKDQKPDVVLAEYGLGGAAIAPLCVELGIPLVTYFLGLDAYGHKILKKWGDGYHYLFNHAARVVAVSKDMQQQLINLGCPPEKLAWVVCGVDPLFAELKVNEHPRQPVFLAVGRFVEKKSPLVLVRSFARVLLEVPDARLVSYGDGPMWEDAKALSTQLGIQHAIHFCGKGKPEVIADEMQHAIAFVQHSVRAENGDSEGTPVAILEASAAGLPIVSTQHAGIKDTVVNGETGILVKEHDEAAFAQGMIMLARDPELALRMGLAGRAYVLKNFGLDKTISDLYHILQEAAKHR